MTGIESLSSHTLTTTKGGGFSKNALRDGYKRNERRLAALGSLESSYGGKGANNLTLIKRRECRREKKTDAWWVIGTYCYAGESSRLTGGVKKGTGGTKVVEKCQSVLDGKFGNPEGADPRYGRNEEGREVAVLKSR